MRRHRQAQHLSLLSSATFIGLALAACGFAACGKKAPVPVSATPNAAVEAPPVATAAVAEPPPAEPNRVQQATGRWCLRSMGDDTRAVLDGSTWQLNADGTYVWESQITTRGTWSLIQDKLALSHAGEHKVIELDADHMVLERMAVQFNLFRECGPEIEEARRVAPLRKAAADGDLLMVKALLDQGVNVNGVDRMHSREFTPLIAAIDAQRVDVVTRLLARGASVTVLSGQDETVFEHARRNNPDEMMPLVLAKLRKPASLNVPSFLKKPESGQCPDDYVAILTACVHTYALPRPKLLEELWGGVDAENVPMLTDWDKALPTTNVVAEIDAPPPSRKIDYNDLSKLDPGALMNPNAPSASSNSRAYADETPTKRPEVSKPKSKPSPKVDWGSDEPPRPPRDDAADREIYREICSQYRPALERVRNGEMTGEALGMSKTDMIRAIEANIRKCEAKGF